MPKLTHLSLFTGYGGLDIAAHWAGFETVGIVEWADYPSELLNKRFPLVPKWKDIKTFTGDDFFERTGRRTVDVVSGGFPCQPFSLAGKRRGAEDDRHQWPQMLRVITEIRPAWVIGENVAGIISMAEPPQAPYLESRTLNRFAGADHYHGIFSRQQNMLFNSIIQDLNNIGYEVAPFGVPACAVQANHERMRTVFVAHADRNRG